MTSTLIKRTFISGDSLHIYTYSRSSHKSVFFRNSIHTNITLNEEVKLHKKQVGKDFGITASI